MTLKKSIILSVSALVVCGLTVSLVAFPVNASQTRQGNKDPKTHIAVFREKPQKSVSPKDGISGSSTSEEVKLMKEVVTSPAFGSQVEFSTANARVVRETANRRIVLLYSGDHICTGYFESSEIIGGGCSRLTGYEAPTYVVSFGTYSKNPEVSGWVSDHIDRAEAKMMDGKIIPIEIMNNFVDIKLQGKLREVNFYDKSGRSFVAN
jgi:hypothetical protein